MARRGTPSFKERHDLGRMDQHCSVCRAKMWAAEKTGGTIREPLFSTCCGKGKYVPENLRDSPDLISSLLKGSDEKSIEFRSNIRAYNSALGFTSLGCNLDQSVANLRGGSYCFRIHGTIYHRIGSLNPSEGETPKFAQIYIHDSSNELRNRHSHNSFLNIDTLRELQTLMHEINPYVHDFKVFNDYLQTSGNNSFSNVSLVFQAEGSPDQRRYNTVTSSSTEIGALIIDSNQDDGASSEGSSRDIIVKPTIGGYKRIGELNQNYDPMNYVLLFPTGQPGWCISTMSTVGGNKVSTMRYYSYRFMIRDDNSCLHLFGNLFQQFIVDMYAKVEQGRLNYLKSAARQDMFRTEILSGLEDAIRANDGVVENANEYGRKTILPSSFVGGARYMAQLYHDAISIVRRFGKPDFFITFTCNPKWPEIQRELLHGQTPGDRPDLSTRVFNKKLSELMDDLIKKNVLGKVIAHIHVIEFQKRGLPHAHILLIVDEADKPRTEQDIDSIVSARIPEVRENDEQSKLAYETVTTSMMHGPCGSQYPRSPCMKDGKCSKGYPRPFSEVTTSEDSGFPKYKRPSDGRTHNGRGFIFNNTWVVPHNLDLCIKYNAHINVEICNTAKSVKYIYKYVYKGHDRANVVIQKSNNGSSSTTANTVNAAVVSNDDEIKQYLDARYVSASEACWRIFSFSLHQEFPAHQRLQIHLEKQQNVLFREDRDIQETVDRAVDRHTTLTAWFDYNQNNEDSRQYLYVEFPEHFVWRNYYWHKRRNANLKTTIGRIYAISPRTQEKYYLRMLLHHVRGATSFDDLRTVDGVICPTYQETARTLNLLLDDNEWEVCLTEGLSYQCAIQLRRLFATILLFCNPSNPFSLWEQFKDHLAEDYIFKHLCDLNLNELPENNLKTAYDHTLLDINDVLLDGGKSLTDYEGFILPESDTRNEAFSELSAVLREHMILNAAAAVSLSDPALLPFNQSQREVYDYILNLVQTSSDMNNLSSKIVFVDGPGGTGKTYLFNALLDTVRRTDNIAIAVAHSGTAATLLKGGRTAHSTFKIPLEVSKETTCFITPKSDTAQLIRKSKIILWDEASMISSDQIGTVDRTFRDIMKSENSELEHVPFGGKLFVFGGDFRQVLPVIPNATRGQTVAQCLNHSPLWSHVQVLKLTMNMRVQQALLSNDPELASTLENFSRYLLAIGDGTAATVNGTECIRVPDEMILSSNGNFEAFMEPIFNSFRTPYDIEPETLVSKAILTPKNNDVTAINDYLLDKFPIRSAQDYKEFLSADSVTEDELRLSYPVEYLNSMNPGSLPPHCLKLKVGSPVMMLRNLSPKNGVCNGTRLIVESFGRNVINTIIATGPNAGNHFLVPRIDIISNQNQTVISFKRRQFPIRPAFAMTINKAQGQTLDLACIYLPSPVFGHGQLYVAFSRARTPSSIKILLNKEKSTLQGQEGYYTDNIVYKEVLQTTT